MKNILKNVLKNIQVIKNHEYVIYISKYTKIWHNLYLSNYNCIYLPIKQNSFLFNFLTNVCWHDRVRVLARGSGLQNFYSRTSIERKEEDRERESEANKRGLVDSLTLISLQWN